MKKEQFRIIAVMKTEEGRHYSYHSKIYGTFQGTASNSFLHLASLTGHEPVCMYVLPWNMTFSKVATHCHEIVEIFDKIS